MPGTATFASRCLPSRWEVTSTDFSLPVFYRISNVPLYVQNSGVHCIRRWSVFSPCPTFYRYLSLGIFLGVCVCVCVCLGTGIHGIASRWYGTPLVLCGCFPKEQPRGRTTNDDDLFLFVRIRCGGPILDFFTHVFYPDLGHNKHCLSVHHGDDSDPCLLSNVGR